MWRDDSKRWEIGIVVPEYLGKADYAYTHWLPLPAPPKTKRRA